MQMCFHFVGLFYFAAQLACIVIVHCDWFRLAEMDGWFDGRQPRGDSIKIELCTLSELASFGKTYALARSTVWAWTLSDALGHIALGYELRSMQ